MQDKKIDERGIDRVEGNIEVKNDLKETWKKFRNKSQDEIVDMLFSSIRT